MRRFILIALLFIAIPAVIFILIYLLLLNESTGKRYLNLAGQKPDFTLFSALPNIVGGQQNSVSKSDARAIIVKNFFDKNKSPLVSYSEYFVWVSDRYGLDFRLLPAIAMQESNAGKKIDQSTHNAWGFANGLTIFKSWPDAIEKVAKTLKYDYIDKGLITPDQIMPKYAPPSVEKGGPWAKGVQQFVDEME